MRSVRRLAGRTEIVERARERDHLDAVSRAPFLLSIDDKQGNGQAHEHGTSGHDFPMTRDELRALRAQIAAVLAR